MASIKSSNTIRFSGLASGIDTESLVNAMLLTQKNKINAQQKKKQLGVWKQEAWKEMNAKINSFNEKYVDKLKMQTTFLKSKPVVSNANAISVSEHSNIGNGVHKVKVEQLATSAFMKTESIDSNVGVKPITYDTTLRELGIESPTKISVGGMEFNINPDDSINDLGGQLSVQGVNLSLTDNQIKLDNAGLYGEEIELKVVDGTDETKQFFNKLGVSSADNFKIKKDHPTTGRQLRPTSLSEGVQLKDLTIGGAPIVTSDVTLNVNGHAITLTGNDTIGTMMSKMRSADRNLSISLDTNHNRFFVNSTVTGENSKTEITGTGEGQNLLNALGIVAGAGSVAQGEQAKYTYNGMEFTSESNDVKINGLEFTLKEVTSEEVTIQGTSNTEEVTKFMKEFITEYNKLMDDINKKLTTKTSKEYEPLTDEEKEATSEKNVEKIEKYIKDGIFYRDADLMALRDSLRDTMGVVVEGNTKYKTLHSIGITTGNWRENGKLHFDEEKFTKALQDDVNEVINLFTGSGSETEAIKDYMKKNNITNESEAQTQYRALSYKDKAQYLNGSKGVFTRIGANLTSLSKSSDYKSYGSFYNDKLLKENLKTIDDLIYNLNQKYTTKEKALYKKFTAMEKMISQLNSQQAALASMIGA